MKASCSHSTRRKSRMVEGSKLLGNIQFRHVSLLLVMCLLLQCSITDASRHRLLLGGSQTSSQTELMLESKLEGPRRVLLQEASGSTSTDDSSVEDNIQATRLFLLNYVLQTAAFRAAAAAPLGQVTNISSALGKEINQQVVRLDTQDLKANGFGIQEFQLPSGLAIPTNSSQVLLVYHSYPSTSSPFTFGEGNVSARIVGLSVYPSSPDVSPGLEVPPLAVSASNDNPIIVSVQPSGSALGSSNNSANATLNQVCATFNASGVAVTTVNTTAPGNDSTAFTCTSDRLGDFTVISLPPSPPSSPPPGAPTAASPPADQGSVKKKDTDNTALGLGLGLGLAGGLLLLILLALCICCGWRASRNAKIRKMEVASDRGPPLETALIGGSRAPLAGAVRTRPMLEPEYPDSF